MQPLETAEKWDEGDLRDELQKSLNEWASSVCGKLENLDIVID